MRVTPFFESCLEDFEIKIYIFKLQKPLKQALQSATLLAAYPVYNICIYVYIYVYNICIRNTDFATINK
jgi:hypothetical protein